MIEGEKKSSAIKNGLLALSKLKGASKHSVPDNIKSNKKLIAIHPKEDMPPQQFNERKEVDLTNANFQIKSLLNGFFINIDDEDKPSNAVDDKLKKLFVHTIIEEDSKGWLKPNQNDNSPRNNISQSSHKNKHFQSSKLLAKMPLINEHISDKSKIKTINNDEVVCKKASSSSRNLPKFSKFTPQTQKKRSCFGMKSTSSLRPVSKNINSSNKNLNILNITIEKDKDLLSECRSNRNDEKLNSAFKLEKKKSSNLNSNNTLRLETDISNKTVFHTKIGEQRFESSSKLTKIKSSTFASLFVNNTTTPKLQGRSTNFKKKKTDESYKDYLCARNSFEQHSQQSQHSRREKHEIHVIKKANTKNHHVKFRIPLIDDCNYPTKAKTLQYRRSKGDNSSLSCGFHHRSKYLKLPSIDILDIEGLSKQNKEELNDIKTELQNHVFVNDVTETQNYDLKSNDNELNVSKQNISSAVNIISPDDDANNNNNITKLLNNSSSNEESNQILINNEANANSGQLPVTINSKKMSIKEEHRKLQQKGYVYDSLDDEEIEDQIEINFYLKPDSLPVKILDFLLFFSILYSAFELPFRLAHDLDLDCIKTGYLNYYVISELIIHSLLILDIIFSFFKAYRSIEYQIITQTSIIAKRYLKSWFILDVISAIPFYSLLRINSHQCLHFIPRFYNVGTKPAKYIVILLRLCKICKVYLNNTWYTAMRSYLLQTEHFYLWFNMYNGILIFFIYVHSMACLFIFFAQTSYESWILNLGYDTAPFFKLYISAIYYVITTVTSTGYGDIVVANRLEYVYNLFLLAIGVQACSYALSSFVDIINANDDKSVEYVKNCKVLEEIRLAHRMPMKLYDKVARLLKYRMIYEKKDKNIIVDSLPLRLRNTLIYEMYKPVIQNFIFFKSFDNKDFVVRVLLAFKPILASKFDILVKEGDYIAEVIFVKSGVLSLEIAIRSKENRRNGRTGLTSNGAPIAKATYSNLNKISSSRTNMFMMYTRSNAGIIKQNSSTLNMRLNSRMSFNPMRSNYEKDESDDSYDGDPTKSHIKGKQDDEGVNYVKILEIRKNEHFGDILMFLDRRSPLTVRVKSKKTELFYLEKTDAVEIASTFPVVWRKIIKKSLFNMEQMERLINKAVKVCNRVYNATTQKEETYNEIGKYSLNADCVNKGSTQKMLTLIKETGLPLGDESDELHSIPSSLESSSQSDSTVQVNHNQTNITNPNIVNKEDSAFEEEEFPTTNGTRVNLLSQGQSQSVIIEEGEGEGEGGCNSEKSKKQSDNNIKDTDLIDDDENSTKYRISTKEATNHNTISTKSNNANNYFIPKHSAFIEPQATIKDNSESKNTENVSNEEFHPIINIDSSSSLTPFKFSDINNEFYPDELNKNDTPPLFKRDNIKVNDIIGRKGMIASIWKAPSPISESYFDIKTDANFFESNKVNTNNENEGNELGLNLLQFSNSNRTIIRKSRASSFDNISICSITTSISLSNSYENLNEISGYSYISSPQLQSKVKTLLQRERSGGDVKEPQQEEKPINAIAHSNTNIANNFFAARSTSSIVFPTRNFLNNNNNNNNNNIYHNNVHRGNSIAKEAPCSLKTLSFGKNLIKSCKLNLNEDDLSLNNESSQHQNPFAFIGGGNSKMMHPVSKKKSSILNFRGNKDLFGIGQPILPAGQISSRGRSSVIVKPKPKKSDLLNVISQNIETNNQILNQPGVFCADYFQKVMVNHNNKIEQQNLYKRLLNTEKILNDFDKGGKKPGNFSPTGNREDYSIQPIVNENG